MSPPKTGLVQASATLRPSHPDLLVGHALDPRIREQLRDHSPPRDDLEDVARVLEERGFTVDAIGFWNVSFHGPIRLFEGVFDTTLEWVVEDADDITRPGGRDLRRGYWNPTKPPSFPEGALRPTRPGRPVVESIQVEAPSYGFHERDPFPSSDHPKKPMEFAVEHRALSDIPVLVNAASCHEDGLRGQQVEVCIVDTGFRTRVTEEHRSTSATDVEVCHSIENVYGVWVPGGQPGTNYYGPGSSYSGAKITLSTPLPSAEETVQVVYSCYHPHFVNEQANLAYKVTVISSGVASVYDDDEGHGVLVAAELLAVAPEVNLTLVCGWGLGGFVKAVSIQPRPSIINCSWGTPHIPSQAPLVAEMASAVESGVVVICAGGNAFASRADHAWRFQSDAGPGPRALVPREVIAVGGAFPGSDGLAASDAASSYSSAFDVDRHVPDLVGLCGLKPGARLTALPTQPGSGSDQSCARDYYTGWQGVGTLPGDGTAGDDGWVVWSGTSTAAAEVSGAAALLLRKYPYLSPNAVRNILENSARDVTGGESASGQRAHAGWDMATGHGMVDVGVALSYLRPGFSPFVRRDGRRFLSRMLWTRAYFDPHSPDIIVTRSAVESPNREYGLPLKHRYDLGGGCPAGQDGFIYVRVQNRGEEAGDCDLHVWIAPHGAASRRSEYRHIGHIAVTGLAPGEFTVQGPLGFAGSVIPSAGRYVIAAATTPPGSTAVGLAANHVAKGVVMT